MAEMTSAMTEMTLVAENVRHRGTGGVSVENRDRGFRPAFLDHASRTVYLSRLADGRPAPFHSLDGLPSELVLLRKACGRVAQVKASVVSGFVRDGRFYSRDEAAAQLRAAA